MVFSRGLLFILLRVLVLVVFAFGLSYSYYKTDLLITPIMFGVLILISAFEITWYLQRQEAWLGLGFFCLSGTGTSTGLTKGKPPRGPWKKLMS